MIPRPQIERFVIRFVALAILGLALAGCSIRKMAINQMADALAESGTAISGDDDPELIRAAVPFSLKLMEIMLEDAPRHKNLLQATSIGFAQYAYAFVQLDADLMEDEDYAAAEVMRDRARRLYIRARNYGLRGLDVSYPNFEAGLRADPAGAVEKLRAKDVPLVYWTAVSWAGAIAVSKDDPALIGELHYVDALIDRALELNPGYDNGAIHSFLITYEMGRQGEGSPADRARYHYNKALEYSGDRLAGPMIALAEAVSIQEQNLGEFNLLLNKALRVDPNAHPESRLVNIIMQRRARWLLSRADELFLITDTL